MGKAIKVTIALILNICTGIIRNKITAILLGPTGLGIFNVNMQAIGALSTIGSMGLQAIIVREVAKKRDNKKSLAIIIEEVRKKTKNIAILLISICSIGTLLYVMNAFGDYKIGQTVELTFIISMGAFFTILTGVELSILRGVGSINELILYEVMSIILLSAIVYASYKIGGVYSIKYVIILMPIVTYLIIKKINTKLKQKEKIEMKEKIKFDVKEGIPLMLSAGILSVINMFVVAVINSELGFRGVGQFAAANTLLAMTLTIAMQGINYSFYPNLVGKTIFKDRRKLINIQILKILLISSVIYGVILITAEYMLKILYSEDFIEAKEYLYTGYIGVLFKSIGSLLSYEFIIRSKNYTLLWLEVIPSMIFLITVSLVISQSGLVGAGICYTVTNLIGLILTYTVYMKLTKYE